MFGSKETTRECPSCALESSTEEEVCPYCGYEFPPEHKGRMIMAWIFVILLIMWLITRW